MMKKRIIVITNTSDFGSNGLGILEQCAEVCVSKGIQDGLSRLSLFSYHLILIFLHGESVMLSQLVETIRKMVPTPVLIVLQENNRNRAELIRTGADVVLENPYDLQEVELQAYDCILLGTL